MDVGGGERVRLSSVCGARGLLRVVTDGAKARPMANLIGLRWCHYGGHPGGHMNIHLTPTTASGLPAAEQGGRNHFEQQQQSDPSPKRIVTSQKYIPSDHFGSVASAHHAGDPAREGRGGGGGGG